MGKILLLLAFAGVVWWLWRKSQVRKRPDDAPSAPPVELMVVCAHCGVNQPRGECVESGGRLYCSDAHRLAAENGRARD